MARIRSIKPEFWTSAQLLECSTNARLLFIGTWTFADDAGRHPWSAKQVKAEIFPADNFTEKQVLNWLIELETNGLIVRYSFEGKEFFYIAGWKHQRIDKPQSPKYPDPIKEDSATIPRTIPPDTIGYDTIREDKKEDGPSLRSGEVSRETSDWPSDFREQFWLKYPRKKAKKAAFKALDRIRKSNEVTFEKLMAAVGKIPIGEPKFIPHPATWLNAGQWDDEQLPGEQNGASAGNIAPAIDGLIERVLDFDRPPDICGTTGKTAVRMLSEGGCERPGDVHSSGDGDLGRISEGSDPLRH
jgi:hypothetical protein